MLTKKPTTALLVEGPVGRTLLQMAIPMFWGMLAVMGFSLVDTFWVGQLGTQELAAMSFTFPIAFAVTGVIMGLGAGISSVISRAIGVGDRHRMQRLTTDAILLALILAGVMIAAGIATIDPLFRALGASDDLLPLIRSYQEIWYAAIGFLVIPMAGNSALRATGDTKTPSVIMAVAGITNILLDPFLIFGWGPFPRLELAGAAWASAISWVLTFAAALWILLRREKMLDLRIPRWKETWASWTAILHMGLPAAFSNLLIPLSTGMLTRMVAAHGEKAVAAFGVGSRIESLASIGLISLSIVVIPFTGQNAGARRHDRVRRGLVTCTRLMLIWGAGACLVLAVAAVPLARLFNEDPELVRLTTLYLWLVPISYGGMGVGMLAGAMFTALGRPFTAFWLLLLRLFATMLPAAWIGGRIWGPEGIFAGMSLAILWMGWFSYWLIKRYLRSEEFALSE